MSKFDSDVDAVLAGDGPIPRESVLLWIEGTTDSDLSGLSKLYRLTDQGYHRIQPELGIELTCSLIQRYLLGCIRERVTGNEEILERFEAAQSLHFWLRHLLGMEGGSAVITKAAHAVTQLFVEGDEDIRYVIETAFLEHALETAALRPYFEHWASDPILQAAWAPALEWGKAHPDFMWGLSQRSDRSKWE